MTFWIVTLGLALAVAALLALALLRSRASADGEPAAAYDLRVYRDQLRDVDRDLARGVLAEAEAERIRTEVSRRILAADTQAQTEANGGAQPGGLSRMAALGVGVALIGGSALLYLGLGAPGQDDQALKTRIAQAEERRVNRVSQATAEARIPPSPATDIDPEYQALIDQLRDTVAKRPDDMQGQELLAVHEARTGNYAAAHKAQKRVIELLHDEAGTKEYARYAELLIGAAGGYVSPEAEQALRAALERDPGNGPARYYWGLMLAQIGRPDQAFRIWDTTLRQGPADAPWVQRISGQIGELAWLAGVDYELPKIPATGAPSEPPPPGPSAEDIEAASQMTADEQQDMIRGMVARLSDRLATEGGSAGEWARLIGALGVLGEVDKARAIYGEARQTFAADAAALATIDNAARQAGVAE